MTDPVRINSQEVIWREVGDEIVILHMTTATYLTINGSGRLLWNRLADGADEPTLIGLLVSEYGIDEAQAKEDVHAFLTALADSSLLEGAS
jgi:hypothetical protein